MKHRPRQRNRKITSQANTLLTGEMFDSMRPEDLALQSMTIQKAVKRYRKAKGYLPANCKDMANLDYYASTETDSKDTE